MRTVGQYRLQSLIGRGATSEVYAAQHALLGDLVAVKLLRPELAHDSTQASALVDEGSKVRAIDHPNVVRVLDAGIDPTTHGCFLVMEHVGGGTLAARLRAEGALPEAEVRRLGAELADGVAAAHARGIVHRDLKPANVMLDGARPKIVDFGIAKHLGARSAVTTGRMIGTLAYMAPEQLSSGMIAPCTDIWALGVILFEAVAGRHPFANFDDGRCPQLFDEPARAASLVKVSPALDAILARCLARDPARRIASADELARLLRGETVLDDERVTADAGPLLATMPSSPVAIAVTRAPARSSVRVVAIGSAAIAALVVLIATRGSNDASRASPPPAVAETRVVVVPADAPEVVELEPDAAPEIKPAKPDVDPVKPRPVVPRVTIRTKPLGAEVLVDGRSRGVTPLTLRLAVGETVVVKHPGYRSESRRVRKAGVLSVTLRKKEGLD